jgi:hypothetical protein
MDWKASYDPVLGYAARKTTRHLYRSASYWKVMATDFANFAARYELERIRRRARFLVKDAGFNAIYAADLSAMKRWRGSSETKARASRSAAGASPTACCG